MDYVPSPLAALIGVWFLNALWPLVSRAGVNLYSPVLFTEAAFITAFLALLPGLAWKGRWRKVFSPDRIPRFLGVGFFYGLPSFLYVAALRYTTPSSAGIVAEVEIFYSMILSSWILRERIGARQIAASLLVVSGTALILAHDAGTAKWKGDALIACCAWMYQVSHILVKRLPEDIDPYGIAAGRIFSVAAIFLVPSLIWITLRPRAEAPSWAGAGYLLLEGVGVIAAAAVCWYAAIEKMDLAKATGFALSYPALTLVFSWALGAETISPVQIAGLSAALAGAIWLSRLMAPARA
ncbi:MAG: DMT family transporter [Elusimicrobiota bacterium]